MRLDLPELLGSRQPARRPFASVWGVRHGVVVVWRPRQGVALK